MCTKSLLVLCLFAFSHTASAYSATFIKKCDWDDFQCAKESAQAALPIFVAGIPELELETLDPLHYDEIDASAKELKLLLSDINIRGVKDCQIKKIQRNNPFTKLFIKALCTVTLDGNYEMGGRLLLLPMEGKGKVHAVLRKVSISVNVDTAEKEKNGKIYWTVKSWKHSYELKDKADIELENLFQGNEVLGRAARELLATSANEVISEVGPPIIKAILSKVVKHVQRFAKAVPAEELTN